MRTPRRKPSRLKRSTIKARPQGAHAPIPIGGRLAPVCRDAAIPSAKIEVVEVMSHTLKIGLLSVSMLLWGVQASTQAAAADEHDRARAEQRPAARAPAP